MILVSHLTSAQIMIWCEQGLFSERVSSICTWCYNNNGDKSAPPRGKCKLSYLTQQVYAYNIYKEGLHDAVWNNNLSGTEIVLKVVKGC